MSPETLLETLRLHGKSSVCLVEPRDAREWAEVVAALLAAQRYTPTPSPTPAAVESVDRTLELAARIVELEQEVARLQGEVAGVVELEMELVRLQAEVARLEASEAATRGPLLNARGLQDAYASTELLARLVVDDLKAFMSGRDFWMREAQTAERQLADLRRERMQSVTQQVAEANLGQRCGCGLCLESKSEAELVNGECADRAACARGVVAQAEGKR